MKQNLTKLKMRVPKTSRMGLFNLKGKLLGLIEKICKQSQLHRKEVKTNMKRYALYARVSTDKQGKNLNVEGQRKALKQIIRKNGKKYIYLVSDDRIAR